MRNFKIVAGLTLGLVIAACQTTLYEVGTTPVTLSQSVVTGFERYKNENVPEAFAIREDGKNYSYIQCPFSSCQMGAEDKALELCNERAKKYGKSCKIFAVGRRVVWKGPITYPTFKPDVYPVNIAITAKDHGGRNNYSGEAKVQDGNKTIYLSMRYRGVLCDGRGDKTTKKWHIQCPYAESFHGTIAEGSNSLYNGMGQSGRGNTIEFTILRRPESPSGAATLPPGMSAAAQLSEPELCARALDPDKEGTWGTKPEFTTFVAEAKRRNIDAGKCEELVSGKTTADKDDNTYIVCLLPSGLHNYISTKSCRRQGGKEAS